MNSISTGHEKVSYFHSLKKRPKYVKSYEGYAKPSDRCFEDAVKQFEEDMKSQKIFSDYVCKTDTQLKGL